jgi:hypothetical protein
LRALWSPVLDPSDGGAAWDLDGGGRRMPQRSFLPDEDRLDSVIRYFAASGLDVHEDRLGQPTMAPTLTLADAETATVVHNFTQGLESRILGLRRTIGRRAYNRVIVESNNPAGPSVRVVLEVDDPTSPMHKSRIGVQTAPVFRSAQVPDLGAATIVAKRLLAEYAYATDVVQGEAVEDVERDAGDIVTFDHEVRSGTIGRYRIDSVAHPVLQGRMSITAGRVIPLLLTEGLT